MTVTTNVHAPTNPSNATQSLLRWSVIHNPQEFRRLVGNILRKELIAYARRVWSEYPRSLVQVRISPIELRFSMQLLQFVGLAADTQMPASCDEHHLQHFHLTADGLLHAPQEGWAVDTETRSIRGMLVLNPTYRQLLSKHAQ